MAETWRERLQRESSEMETSLRAVLASSSDDATLRRELEALAQRRYLAEFTWLWGPALAQRNRVVFRPFILAHFGAAAMNARGEMLLPWQGVTAPPLEAWLRATDAADDVEVTRRLYGWRLQNLVLKERDRLWRDDVVARFKAAKTPAERAMALAKVDAGWMVLDAPAALALYECDATLARPFILAHLPWFAWSKESREPWEALLARSRGVDATFHFDLYRRVVDEAHWRTDLLELCRTTLEPSGFDAELEQRHPRTRPNQAADVFYELVKRRGRDAVPYVMRHASSVFPRWGMFGKKEGKGLPELLALAKEHDWFDLWATLLRTGATKELFSSEVKRLVQSKELPEGEARRRLGLIAGPGREANFPGISFAQVHPLDEDTALLLYRRFPELVRGPFRMHLAPAWHCAYPKVAQAALTASDTELVDYVASRAAIQFLSGREDASWAAAMEILGTYYEALPEAEFVRAGADALSRMPAFAVWNYDSLLRSNRLARLFFERSTALYLADGRAVRDLLESPQIHVQVLAFRILGRAEPRAIAIAASNRDLLQATLFRSLHRRTRLLAFKAIANAARHDEGTARYLLGRMRDALALPEKRYPTEKLVGLMGQVLHHWPALRTPAEAPRIHGEVRA